jgi:hypothetical protein
MKATFMDARFMKATFRSAQYMKATFMNPEFMKATFMERAGRAPGQSVAAWASVSARVAPAATSAR